MLIHRELSKQIIKHMYLGCSWLAQSVEHAILDLGVVSPSLRLTIEIT